MTLTPGAERAISRAAWAMAALGTILGQLHALSRVASHPEDLEYPLTRAWAVPAMDSLSPLLGWGEPYFVYWTYGKIWLPVFAAFTAAAFVVYRRRRPVGRERLVWRGTLAGYVVLTISVFGDYYTPWTEQSFMFVGGPGLLLTALGSTALGITLLRKGLRPRVTAVLALFIPLFVGITQVTSMGMVALPLMWGGAIAAHAVLNQRHSSAAGDAVAGMQAQAQVSVPQN